MKRRWSRRFCCCCCWQYNDNGFSTDNTSAIYWNAHVIFSIYILNRSKYIL